MSVGAVRSGEIDETNPSDDLGPLVHQRDPLTDARAAAVLLKLKPLFDHPTLGELARRHLYVGEDFLIFRVNSFDMLQYVRAELEQMGLQDDVMVELPKIKQLTFVFKERLIKAS